MPARRACLPALPALLLFSAACWAGGCGSSGSSGATGTPDASDDATHGTDSGGSSPVEASAPQDATPASDASHPTTDAANADGASGADPGLVTPAGYTLVWEDLFDTGTVPDPSNWSLYDSPGNGGNGLRRPSAFTVHDGMLDVLADMQGGQLVSGGMSAVRSQTFGYVEFRVRSDPDPSQATDAVVLTWPDDGIWPQHGENDIYETGTGATRDPFNSYVHYGSTGSTQYAFTEMADGRQWHVMGMEWAADHIRIDLDGAPVGTVTDTAAIPMVSHHVCIQLDAYATSIAAPTHMYVDWVAVFQK